MSEPTQASVPSPIPMKLWGRDHWSTLCYIETCCVDHKVQDTDVGQINKDSMRTDAQRHPLLVGPRVAMSLPRDLSKQEKYPTRLMGGVLVHEHDDWDILDDLEEAGLVEIMSLANGYVRMSIEGSRIAALVRAFKAQGGSFATFTMAAEVK